MFLHWPSIFTFLETYIAFINENALMQVSDQSQMIVSKVTNFQIVCQTINKQDQYCFCKTLEQAKKQIILQHCFLYSFRIKTFQIKRVSDSIFLLVYLEYSYILSSERETEWPLMMANDAFNK